MKVLVIGGGGREYAIVKKLSESKKVDEIIVAPGNGGIEDIATCVKISATDVEGMTRFAVENNIDFCVVTPDDPLALGMVDAMENAGIPSFGPNKAAARIEASKSFAKEIMRKYSIPTADYMLFEDKDEAKAYIAKKGAPIVIKADGLAKGKGVIVAQTVEEAIEAVNTVSDEKEFGKAGSKILVEECLFGTEASIMCFSDGKNIKPMISSQDHKRIFDGDKGGNTGGMGAFAPSPFYTDDVREITEKNILRAAVDGMAKEGCPFKGVLYAGIMITKDGPKVIEFNSRFGDPETQVVLPLLKSDLMDIMMASREGTLDKIDVEWSDEASAIVIMSSKGYPGKSETGYEITGLDEVCDAQIVHAGTKKVDGKFVTSGGRVLGVLAKGENLDEALAKAYREIKKVKFEGAHYRNDIGGSLRK